MRCRTLADYPYVRVRLACRICRREGSYRLARLAAKYGAEIDLEDLVARLSADCGVRRTGQRRNASDFVCGARLFDLEPPQPPPNLPAALRKLRVVGGRG